MLVGLYMWRYPQAHAHLMNSIQKLQEDRTKVCDVRGGCMMTLLRETVTKREPIFLNECFEPS